MDLAKVIDHTNLGADATQDDIKKTCKEAKEFGFYGVCINPRWVKLAKAEVLGSEVKVSTVIDWPRGASSTEVRVFAAKVVKKDGADAIDPVMNIGDFKAGNYDIVLDDFKALAKILPVKMILETGFLTDEEIRKACLFAKEAGIWCVKTSTSVQASTDIDTKVKHVRIIREAVPDLKIKAAGGIKTKEDVKRLLEAGADIIGTSSGIEIVMKSA